VDAEYCWRRLVPGTWGTLGTSLETEGLLIREV